MSKTKLAIIGYGDFSKLMIKHLSPHADIVVSSRQKIPKTKQHNFKKVSLEEALDQRIIIPSMPAGNLQEFFKANKHLVNKKALVIDVCSVKIKPVNVLKKVLPKTVSILATHPLFGPATAKSGLEGRKIMIFPARIPSIEYQKIKNFLAKKLNLKIIECTPEDHDKQIAYVQGLSHYIGRVMQIMAIPNSTITTDAYDDLLDMKNIQGGDSWELFESIMQDNPFALKINQEFKQAMRKLDKKL